MDLLSNIDWTFDDTEYDSKEDFNKVELKFEMLDEISNYILNNSLKNISLEALKLALRKELGITISTSELKAILGQLNAAGLMNVVIKDGNIEVTKPDDSRSVSVMYSYEVRKGLG